MSSSTTTALSRQPLTQVLKNITDPRNRRGVRHDLPTVLSLAVTGVLAGCLSLTAIWEHTTDLTAANLEALGLQAGQALASESTRRVLQDLDPADVDAHLRSWLCTRTGTIAGRRVIAVDGKTMRGARTGKDPAPHLLAALDQATEPVQWFVSVLPQGLTQTIEQAPVSSTTSRATPQPSQTSWWP